MGNEFLGEKLFKRTDNPPKREGISQKIIPTCQSTKVRLTCWND